jgi:hypothetical protein
MEHYWFKIWLKNKGVHDTESLRKAFPTKGVDDFLAVASEGQLFARDARISAYCRRAPIKL